MLPIHIIGHAGCGKTRLIVDLVTDLTKRNISIGTMKHSAHVHELDKPGKDSFLHRQAGAAKVAMVTEEMSAIYLPKTESNGPLHLIETYFTDVDIVLIEGWISGPFQKIEVWRKSQGRPPLFPAINHVKALVTDDSIEQHKLPILSRQNVIQITDFILKQF
ncbi:MAG: molybdopterin-guanine dinucleotide biosynthesis protein B [Desulfobacula sp.]|nr:molybdopterin-guanine dinucleotide biosynthesis protein B [Desulfobacula sp.]